MARTDYGAILSTVIKDTSDSIREVNETSALIAPNEWGGLIRAMHSDSEYQSALAGLQKNTIENVPIASFNALSGVKLDSLKVLVEAVQSGSGTPSPSNPRPITGWSGANVTVNDGQTPPIIENVYTISFGDTYYGGELDVTNGVLMVTWGMIKLSDLNWTGIVSNPPVFRAVLSSIPNIQAPASNSTVTTAFTESFSAMSYTAISSSNIGKFAISATVSNRVVFIDDSVATLEAFLTKYGNDKLVYPLATPIEIQLTPTQIAQLAENNIWADTGDVSECVYYASGSEPQYDITQICDNSSYSSTLTLTDSYSNYDFLKIVIYNSNDSKEYTIFTIPSVLDQIATYGNNLVNFNTVMETNIYCAYTMTSSSTWTRYGNRNSNIKAIYGYKATNKTVSVTPIYARQNITTSSVTPTSTTSLYDYDIIFLATCSGAVDETQPCNNVIYPKGKFNGIPHYFILNKYLGATCVAMTEFTLGANSNYFGVYGIKFE